MNFTDTDYELHLYLDALWRRRTIFLLVVICMPILAVMSTYFLPQKYKAHTSIAININALPAMKDISTPTSIADRFQELKAYVTSPASLQKIAVDTGMVVKTAKPSELQGISEQIGKGLTIDLLDKNVIEIVLIQNTPRGLVDILNAVSHSMIKQLTSQESSTAQASMTLLSNAMQIQKQRLKASVDALSQYENKNPDLLPEYADIYQSQLRQINTDIGKQQASYSAINAEKEEMEQTLRKINPIVTEIDAAILENDIKLSKLRLTYTDNYSGIKALVQLNQSLKTERDKRQKAYQELDENKIQQLWNLSLSKLGSTKDNGNYQLLGAQLEKLVDLQLKLKGITQGLVSLTEQKNAIHKKLRLLTTNKQTFIELKQAIKDNQAAYEDVLSRNHLAKMSVGLDKDEQSSSARVVSYPEKPNSSLSKPVYFFLILGLFAGVLCGLGLTTVLELIDNRARSKRTLEAATGFEVLCRVERLTTA
jgi:uncharacterized protein involved in exopolysaccharide biosynthesis